MNNYILTKNIYLFRHGETDWNKLHKRQGCENDIELNDTGREQAAQVGNYLLNTNIVADLIISSSMSRANETAQIIASKINYQLPILIIDNLKSNSEFDKYIQKRKIQ